MTCQCQHPDLLTSAFEEVALALGGVVDTYEVPDDAVWDLARAIDLILERARSRFTEAVEQVDAGSAGKSGYKHPAVDHLLHRIWEAGD